MTNGKKDGNNDCYDGVDEAKTTQIDRGRGSERASKRERIPICFSFIVHSPACRAACSLNLRERASDTGSLMLTK